MTSAQSGSRRSQRISRLLSELQQLPRNNTTTMSCAASQRCLVQLLREPIRSRSVPTFLVPALSQPSRTQCFSTTSAARSRVGGAPVSIPPEVNLRLVDLPQTQVRGKSKEAAKIAVEVNGPLGTSCHTFARSICSLIISNPGQMTLNIPPFVNINHDETARKATISVQDTEIPHQRAMWGMFPPSLLLVVLQRLRI